jgi:hypothetical protein
MGIRRRAKRGGTVAAFAGPPIAHARSRARLFQRSTCANPALLAASRLERRWIALRANPPIGTQPRAACLLDTLIRPRGRSRFPHPPPHARPLATRHRYSPLPVTPQRPPVRTVMYTRLTTTRDVETRTTAFALARPARSDPVQFCPAATPVGRVRVEILRTCTSECTDRTCHSVGSARPAPRRRRKPIHARLSRRCPSRRRGGGSTMHIRVTVGRDATLTIPISMLQPTPPNGPNRSAQHAGGWEGTSCSGQRVHA